MNGWPARQRGAIGILAATTLLLALAKDVAWAELWSPHKAPWEALSSAATSATRCRLRCSR